ncbi:MAG: CehA/McbA family metallohydrolase [archaeon]
MILELHMHSHYSDGMYSPRVMAKHVKKLDLDGFALVDHETVKGHKDARAAAKEFGLEFVPGIEVAADKGHILGLGVTEYIDKGPVEDVLEEIKSQGGVSVAAHPYDFFRHGIGGDLRKFKFDYVEGFNSRVVLLFLNYFAQKAAKELKLPMTAGSDAHDLACLGLGTTRVDSIEDLYKGKAQMHKTEWAGIRRISVEKTQRILRSVRESTA